VPIAVYVFIDFPFFCTCTGHCGTTLRVYASFLTPPRAAKCSLNFRCHMLHSSPRTIVADRLHFALRRPPPLLLQLPPLSLSLSSDKPNERTNRRLIPCHPSYRSGIPLPIPLPFLLVLVLVASFAHRRIFLCLVVLTCIARAEITGGPKILGVPLRVIV